MIEFRNALAVIIDGQTVLRGESLWIGDDGNVVSPDATLPERVVDVTGCVITPGLVNAHNHLMQSAFRTLPGSRGVFMREWLGVMARAYAKAGIDESLTYAAARVAAAEALLSGVTTLADHQLNWPSGTDIDAVIGVARGSIDGTRSVGARSVFVRGTAGDDPAFAAESAEAMLEALRLMEPGGVSADGMVQFAVGPAGVHSDSRQTFLALGDVARRHGLRRRTQANEQVDVDIALDKFGRRPLDLLDEWGWLEPDVTVAHLCSLEDAEIGLVAERGITATHAPGCDLPMGWGLSPVRRLMEAGVTVGLGTSGGGSNDAGHLLADARLAMQASGLAGPALSAEQVIAMATEGSALGLGRPELGALRPGYAADFCVWDLGSIYDAGVHDPVAGLIWSNPGRRPRDTYVAGKQVVADGRLLTADPQALRRELKARVPLAL